MPKKSTAFREKTGGAVLFLVLKAKGNCRDQVAENIIPQDKPNCEKQEQVASGQNVPRLSQGKANQLAVKTQQSGA